MFETQDFRNQVQRTIINEAASNDIKQYQPGIVDFLVRLASSNEKLLMESEIKKEVSERRGTRDAIISVRLIIKEASAIAKRDERNLLTISDVQLAYETLFCQIWPFCR